MNKNLAKILIFIATLLIMGILGALYSLVFAGISGSAALKFAPARSYQLVEKFICPPGAHIQPENEENAKSIRCLFADGTNTPDLKDRATSAVFSVLFLACFLPTFTPGAIILWLTINRWSKKNFDENSEPLEPEDH